jgi:hypothetical protein
MRDRFVRFLAVFTAVAVSACESPEAGRVRGGGPGGDIGNRGEPVELHAGSRLYHQTPCVTQPVPCEGPAP